MLRFGTRNSELALAQAQVVVDWVSSTQGVECELVPQTSAGDRGEKLSDKSRWVVDLEDAILAGEIDFAIHSAKDVPGELAEGLALVGTHPVRGDARDALCGVESLDDLTEGATVGTSSLRRGSQLLAHRPDLNIVELRGNIDSRLRKLAEGGFDAIALAAAGLDRIGRSEAIGARLPVTEFVPAPGQGILAVEGRADERSKELFLGIPPDLAAERTLVEQLGADCHSPVGTYARIDDDETLELFAYVGLPDGSHWIRDRIAGESSSSTAIAVELAARLESVGASEILIESRANA